MFNSSLDLAEIQAAGEKNAAYLYYYTTKPARKPVTYVHRSGNSIGVTLGIGLSGCDIDKCYDADTGVTLLASRLSDLPMGRKHLSESLRTVVECLSVSNLSP
jgi:hypothetical protein